MVEMSFLLDINIQRGSMDTPLPQHIRSAVIAVTAGIPLLGGPVSVLLDKYLPDYVKRKRDAFLEQVGKGLSEIEERLTPENLSSDTFLSVFVKATQQAIAKHSQEKVDCLRAIILNSALEPTASFDERSLFLRLVADLTEDQIKVLKAIYVAGGIPKDKYKSLLDYAVELWPEIDPDYLMACTTELIRYNFVSGAYKTRGEQVGLQESKSKMHRLTGLGERFVTYILSPLTLRSTGSSQKTAQTNVMG
jgi:hypothetical protein